MKPKSIEEIRAKHAKEIADQEKKLQIHEKFCPVEDVSICLHGHAGHQWASVTYSRTSYNPILLPEALELIQQHRPHIIECHTVKGTFTIMSPIGMEDKFYGRNYRYDDHEEQYRYHIEIHSNGGEGYYSTRISYWVNHPEVGYLDINIEIHPPSEWIYSRHYESGDGHIARFKGFREDANIKRDHTTRYSTGDGKGIDRHHCWESLDSFLDYAKTFISCTPS